MLGNNHFVVVGGGHAGVEAAFAIARLGCTVSIITMDKKALGRLSCNPAIGGLAKTHLVKEIDALGGVMGFVADHCALQYKTLNKTKGRAVWSTRAQVDKKQYPLFIKKLINKEKKITVLEGEVTSIIKSGGCVSGVEVNKTKNILCAAVIIACGTFAQGLIHLGSKSFPAGRFGEKRSEGLSGQLHKLGHSLIRLKTGTPPRISLSSLETKRLQVSSGEKQPFRFSLFSPKKTLKKIDCFLVNTNKKTHSIINKNLKKSAMFSGKIKGVGPRYCPSIEDKIFRFSTRNSHHLFLEPEWLGGDQIYVNGFSTSLPHQIQLRALQSVVGLEKVEFIRPGYAIEYDVVPPRELKRTLESKLLGGLFLAGQVNGTSGYEEAAAQGLVAGVNAVFLSQKKPPFILPRSLSYIGVMIDDLTTSHLDEPYRMFTSRAEHRLFLRPDNCYSRLSVLGLERGLLSKKRAFMVKKYLSSLGVIKKHVGAQKVFVGGSKISFNNYIKRPSSSFNDFSPPRDFVGLPFFKRAVFEVETEIKYSGYIENEMERIEKNKLLEQTLIPFNFNYSSLSGLSCESAQRLSAVRPETLGQASRVFGIRPTDITLLAVCLNR